jgi:enoyl-CoA hydratase/carnithine racemase
MEEVLRFEGVIKRETEEKWHKVTRECDPTQIGLMNGIIMGGGAGLVHPAHYQVCTDDTIFAMPETGIGFFPDVGATYWLSRKADMRQKGLKTHGQTRSTNHS